MSTGQTGRIYWANAGAQAVSCANLDGGEGRDVCATSKSPLGLTVDRRNERLWFTVPDRNALCWTELTGSNDSGSQGSGAELGPLGLAVNGELSPPLLYWSGAAALYGSNEGIYCTVADRGGIGQNWARAGTRGPLALDAPATLYCAVGDCILCLDVHSVPSSVLGEACTPGPIGGIALDTSSGALYSTNSEEDRIERRRFESNEGTVLATPGATVAEPAGIAVDAVAEKAYWANRKGGVKGTGAISWAHLDGTGGGDIKIAGATIDAPCGIALLMAPSVEALPTISGSSMVGGQPLQCDPGSCAPDESGGLVFRDANSIAYQWLFEGNPIDVATEPSYSPQQGGCYSCAVTYVNPAGKTVAEAPPHSVQEEK